MVRIIWFIIKVLLVIAILILFYVLVPKNEWSPGDSYDEWIRGVAGCSANDRSCKIDQTTMCWACSVSNHLMNIMDTVGDNAFRLLSNISITFMLVALAFWIAFTFMQRMLENAKMNAPGEERPYFSYLEKFGPTFFKVVIAAAVLGLFGDKDGELIRLLFRYTVNPMMRFGSMLSSSILGGEGCGMFGESEAAKEAMDVLVSNSGEGVGIFTSELKRDYFCMMSSFNIFSIGGISSGYNYFIHQDIGKILNMFVGYGIMVLFFLMMLWLPLVVLDTIMIIGFAFAFSPLLLVSWALSDTGVNKMGGDPYKPFSIIWNNALYFAFIAISYVTVFALFIFVADLFYPPTPGDGPMLDGFNTIFPDFFSPHLHSNVPEEFLVCENQMDPIHQMWCYENMSAVGFGFDYIPLLAMAVLALIIMQQTSTYAGWFNITLTKLGYVDSFKNGVIKIFKSVFSAVNGGLSFMKKGIRKVRAWKSKT
jgi:hypothetical protein